jgi:mannonate dehydratase
MIELCAGTLNFPPQDHLACIFHAKENRTLRRTHSQSILLGRRNAAKNGDGDFVEASHLGVDVDKYEVIKALLIEQNRRLKIGRKNIRMPTHPDHGHLMLPELHKQGIYPGYSLFGRMRALAELQGIELGIQRSLGL